MSQLVQLQNRFGHFNMAEPKNESLAPTSQMYEGAGEQWSVPINDESMTDPYSNSNGRDSLSKIFVEKLISNLSSSRTV